MRRSAFKRDVRRSNATFDVQNAKISNGHLPPEDGSHSCQTLGKRVSDVSQRFIFRRRNFFQNFERPFTPRGWLRLASNFGKTRFRWSPTFHFSMPTNIFSDKHFCQKNFSSTPQKHFRQSACFGGAVQVYTPLAYMQLENSLPEL